MLKNHGRHNRIIRACIEILFCNELLLENNSSNMLQLSTLEGSFPPERCQPLSDLPNHCSLQMSSTGCHPSKLYFHELIEETSRASGLPYSKLHRVGKRGPSSQGGLLSFLSFMSSAILTRWQLCGLGLFCPVPQSLSGEQAALLGNLRPVWPPCGSPPHAY